MITTKINLATQPWTNAGVTFVASQLQTGFQLTIVVNLSPGTFIERLLFVIISGPRGKTKVRLKYISLFKAIL